MRTSHPLRLYANPLRLFFLCLLCTAFTVIGVLIVRDPTGVPCGAVGAWLCLIFFGLCAAIIFLQLVRDGILRRPVLQIDEQGWSSRPTLFMRKRTAHWQDIAHVGLYRQFIGHGASTYWLVVHAKDPNKVVRVSFGPFAKRFYPSLRGAMMAVPLNQLFLRATPKKAEEVLRRLISTYEFEFTLYGIQASTRVQIL
jgi:hypothetical protein